ncbi:hypothetical protein BC940DRAFT_293723 [Gongronella butleri]|nr:hypothetical protein BC940DRAFT_293723 [Gongronella butleri]
MVLRPLLLLLCLLAAYVAAHDQVRVSVPSFATKASDQNKKIYKDNDDYPMATSSSAAQAENTNSTFDKTTSSLCPLSTDALPPTNHELAASHMPWHATFLDTTLPLLVDQAKTACYTAIDITVHVVTDGFELIKAAIIELDVPDKLNQAFAFLHDESTAFFHAHVRPLTYRAQRAIYASLGHVGHVKDHWLQYVDDVITAPGLEWHLLSSNVSRRWMTLCHHMGIDAYVRHIYHRVMSLFVSDGIGAIGHMGNPNDASDAFATLDSIFQDMVTTDFHGVFYKKQMTHYYQSLSAHDQHLVQYSKRDFVDWANQGAARTHQFVVQTQQDWISLMHELYDKLEAMLDCLAATNAAANGQQALPTPSASFRCSANQRQQALLLLTTHMHQQPRSRYEWMYELDQIYAEIEKTIDCVCPSAHKKKKIPHHDAPHVVTTTTAPDDAEPTTAAASITATSASMSPSTPSPTTATTNKELQKLLAAQKTDLMRARAPVRGDDAYQPTRQSVDLLMHLKKSMIQRFHRMEKHLHRQLYAAVPPRRQQPIHFIYERLWENVSALNKATYEKYLMQLILSWTNMMANTLDMVNTVADDLAWIAQKQQRHPLNTSTNHVDHENDHGHDNDRHHHDEAMALIWTSAQRKMEKNNRQLVNQWEMIFLDMDHELQAAWNNVLDMVDVSHRSSYERVRTFWRDNKSRLQHLFSSLFPDNSAIATITPNSPTAIPTQHQPNDAPDAPEDA